ncbi:MAG TPA: alpha/beta hydrolase [Bauldia sp.]|nr:alpha/beta hydrolase [Bauldia sp.]
MPEPIAPSLPSFFEVGEPPRRLACRVRRGGSPGLFWLSGFGSNMDGHKAGALDVYAERNGLAYARFDYSGHGLSAGNFADGTISDWLEEATFAFEKLTGGPQIVVGSSMGGWIALLLAAKLHAAGNSRIAGMVLIAPATDMTEELMWQRMTRKVRKEIQASGRLLGAPDAPQGENTITLKLIEDGRKHLFGDRPIEVGCPVHILQGQLDESVPWSHATKLAERLASDDVVLTLVKDGDHRLSRPEDLDRLFAAIDGLRVETGLEKGAPTDR